MERREARALLPGARSWRAFGPEVYIQPFPDVRPGARAVFFGLPAAGSLAGSRPRVAGLKRRLQKVDPTNRQPYARFWCKRRQVGDALDDGQ